jgi:hypothetical protein
MADLYREKVTKLARGLEHEESRIAAAEALRGLSDSIVLIPEEGELKIELPRAPSETSSHPLLASVDPGE